jgi:microprocessor complex subunit DGCR8
MEGDDLEDSMDETVVDKTMDTSQTQQSTGQPKIYHRWTVKGYWQDKHKHSLPDGWCEVFHTSGFPLYFHKQTRVVTLSRPYFLGSISVRHHLIPVASIPCLYMKRLQEEQDEPGESLTINDESKCPFKTTQQEDLTASSNRKRKRSEDDVEEGEISSPHPSTATNPEESSPPPPPSSSSTTQIISEIPSTRPTKPQQLPVSLQILTNSTLDDALRFSTLTSDELRSYCQRRFAFEQREFKFFPSLGDKWKYIRQEQMKRREINTPADAQIIELQPLLSNDQSVVVSATLKQADTPPQPSLKSSTTTPIISELNNLNNKKVTIDLYPSKSPIALLQEYALKRLKLTVRYDWFTTDVSNSPFGCRVLVGDIVYGTGIGRNKRTAKLNATEESLLILLPQYKKLQEQQQQQQPIGNKETIIEEKSVEEEGCIDDDEISPIINNNSNHNDLNEQEQINSTLLDEYCISDANIYDVCVTLGKQTPYQMLEKSLTYNALTRGESNIKLTMTKKPMFTHITLEIGNEHREEAQAKDKAHAKNLGITKKTKRRFSKSFHFLLKKIFFLF